MFKFTFNIPDTLYAAFQDTPERKQSGNMTEALRHLMRQAVYKNNTDKNTIGQTGGPQNVEISESTVGGAARHGGS